MDDIFSLWHSDKKEINLFIEQANNFDPTTKEKNSQTNLALFTPTKPRFTPFTHVYP